MNNCPTGRYRKAGPTPSQEIIGQMNCANVGPLNCVAGTPQMTTMDYNPGGGSMVGNGNDFQQPSVTMLRSNSRQSSFADTTSYVGNDDSQYLEGCRRIVDSMNRLWQEQKLCDVVIQACGDQLKAHKLALAAYSDFLVEKFCKFPAGWLLCSRLHCILTLTVRVRARALKVFWQLMLFLLRLIFEILQGLSNFHTPYQTCPKASLDDF